MCVLKMAHQLITDFSTERKLTLGWVVTWLVLVCPVGYWHTLGITISVINKKSRLLAVTAESRSEPSNLYVQINLN